MKYISLLSFTFLFCLNLVQGQSIPSYWMNIYQLENYYETDSGDIKSIKINKVTYLKIESYKSKWVYKFPKENIVKGRFFNKGELKSEFTYTLDSLNRKVKIEMKSKTPLVGWEKTKSEFLYKKNKRIMEKHFDSTSNLIRIGNYEYDSLGYLVQLTLNSGYETAIYYHEESSYIYRIFNNQKELISEKILFANKSKDQNKKNEFGDLTRLLWPTANPDYKVFHVFEYQYDKKGNWIKRKRFMEKNGRKRLLSKVVRKIKYR